MRSAAADSSANLAPASSPFSPEARRGKRRWSLIIVVVCAVILLAALLAVLAQPADSLPDLGDVMPRRSHLRGTPKPAPAVAAPAGASNSSSLPGFLAIVAISSLTLLAALVQISGYSLRDLQDRSRQRIQSKTSHSILSLRKRIFSDSCFQIRSQRLSLTPQCPFQHALGPSSMKPMPIRANTDSRHQ